MSSLKGNYNNMPNLSDEQSMPSKYCKRDLLALMQLLHTNGLINPDSVTESSIKSKDVHIQWYNLASTKLSIFQEVSPLYNPPTPQIVFSLYSNLLKDYPNCKNTTELANMFYLDRIEELEKFLGDSKHHFNELLSQEARST